MALGASGRSDPAFGGCLVATSSGSASGPVRWRETALLGARIVRFRGAAIRSRARLAAERRRAVFREAE
jgi:hypothetical protein